MKKTIIVLCIGFLLGIISISLWKIINDTLRKNDVLFKSERVIEDSSNINKNITDQNIGNQENFQKLKVSEDASFQETVDIYNKNFSYIQEKIYSGERDILDIDFMDTFIPIKYMCDVFSKNIDNNIKLKEEISKSKIVFIIPESSLFNEKKLQDYNSKIVDFYTNEDMKFQEFYQEIIPLYKNFVKNSSNKKLTSFIDVYKELYSVFYAQVNGGEKVQCDSFLEKNFTIISQEY